MGKREPGKRQIKPNEAAIEDMLEEAESSRVGRAEARSVADCPIRAAPMSVRCVGMFITGVCHVRVCAPCAWNELTVAWDTD